MAFTAEEDIPNLYTPSFEPTFDMGGLGSELFKRYTDSEHGKWHAAQQLRYENTFGCYDRQQMLTDLGLDVHPLNHMPVTDHSLLDLMTLEAVHYDLSPSDIQSGRTAAILHDIGECTHPAPTRFMRSGGRRCPTRQEDRYAQKR